MVGHGSLSPVLLSVLLVPLFVLGLPRRRLAGLATHILIRMLAFVFRLRVVGSLPFLQQSRPAGFDSPRLRNPTSEASLLSRMKIRESVVSLSFIFPHPPEDIKKKKSPIACRRASE